MQKRLTLTLMLILAMVAYSCSDGNKNDVRLTPEQRCEYLGLCNDSDLTPEQRCEYLGLCDDSELTPEQRCEYLGLCDDVIVPNPIPVCNQPCTKVGEVVCTNNAVKKCTKLNATCNAYVEQSKCPLGCDGNACKANPNPTCDKPCTQVGAVVCTDSAIKKCTKISATCNAYVEQSKCPMGCDGNACRTAIGECELVNNSNATIVSVTDGDTAWVMVKNDNCTPKKHRIRLHGIDASECYKERNAYFYYECVQNSSYDNDNELYGYEASVAANDILRRNIPLKLTCDYPGAGGVCPFDDTGARYLTYISVNYNGKTVDFSTEMARQGMAFSFVRYPSSKRAQICRAQNEAVANRAGIWSQGSTPEEVVSQLGSNKRSWVKTSLQTCAND